MFFFLPLHLQYLLHSLCAVELNWSNVSTYIPLNIEKSSPVIIYKCDCIDMLRKSCKESLGAEQ